MRAPRVSPAVVVVVRLALGFGVGVGLGFPPRLAASVADAETLSLGEAQTEARAHAPEAALLEARIRGVKARATDAERIFRNDPVVKGRYEPGVLAGSPEETSWEAGIEWTLDVAGTWAPRRRSASAELDRARFEQEEGLLALDEAVAVSVADLAEAQRGLARAERIEKLFAMEARAIEKALEVGEASRLDADQADLDLAEGRATTAEAAGALETAQARLARLLGRERFEGLAVEDPVEPVTAPPAGYDLAAAVERNPHVLAAEAQLLAAQAASVLADRLVWPSPTVGLGYDYRRTDIPAGSFSGLAASGLSANWVDEGIGLSLSLPLPIVDRKGEARARAVARELETKADAQAARAEVQAEAEMRFAAFRAAAAAYERLAPIAQVIERDILLLEEILATGVVDIDQHARAIRRLENAGGRLDHAIRNLRVARARWTSLGIAM